MVVVVVVVVVTGAFVVVVAAELLDEESLSPQAAIDIASTIAADIANSFFILKTPFKLTRFYYYGQITDYQLSSAHKLSFQNRSKRHSR